MGTVGCWDEVANGGDEEIESLLGILDFPMEGLDGDDFIGDWDTTKSADYFGPIPSDMLMNSGPLVLPPTPKIDATRLKQPSSYLPEDTFHQFIIRPNKTTEAREPEGVFQMQSPISVLENNGSVIKSCTTKRARSKRANRSGLCPWLSMLPLPSGKPQKRVRERRKPPQVNTSDKAENPLYSVTKRCAHCQVTKTPQWREGPMGPKTLCNACGVRYRSGRLFPEYRPAASPTFVAAIHSNSHRKVVEMRSKAVKVEEVVMSPEAEFVPGSSYLFDDPV